MTEQPFKGPKTLTKTQGRTLVLVFFAMIGLMTWFLTRGLGPLIDEIKYDASSSLHFYKVTEVISGDTLRVESNRTRSRKKYKRSKGFPWLKPTIVEAGSNEVIRVIGILAPPPSYNHPEAAAFMASTGVPPAQLAHLADISHKSLLILLRRQLVDLELSDQTTTWNGETVRLAQVKKSGIDIAVKQLDGCQVMITTNTHKYATEYQELENAARAEQLGIWRYLPQK